MKQEMVEAVADEISKFGVVIGFKPNSIFAAAELENDSNNPITTMPVSEDEQSSAQASRTTKLVANAIVNEIDIIKNTYYPVYKKYITDSRELLASNVRPNTISKYEIISVILPQYLTMLNDNNAMGTNTQQKLPIYSMLIPCDKIDVSKLTLGVSLEEDKYIGELLAGKDAESITTIAYKYFGQTTGINYVLEDARVNSIINIDELCIAHVLTRYLEKNMPDGTVSEGNDYQQYMQAVRGELQSILGSVLKSYSVYGKIDRLILSCDLEYKIYVHNEVYTKAKESGITADCVLGLLLTLINNKSADYAKYSLDSIKTNLDIYLGTWDGALKRSSIVTAAEELQTYKAIYSLGLARIFSDESLSKTDFVNDIKKVDTLLDQYLNTLPITDVKNIDKVGAYVVGSLLLENDLVFNFISDMLEYVTTDNTITTEQAATLSAVNMIANYLVKQITVTKV